MRFLRRPFATTTKKGCNSLGLRRRFLQDEQGNPTVEFVIIFPIYMLIFLASFEVGLLNVRQVMLERSVDLAVRQLRLGNPDVADHAGLKSAICARTVVINNCGDSVLIELTPISTDTWSGLEPAARCIDRKNELQPVTTFVPGSDNEMMMVRVCAVLDPLFPSTGLAAHMQLDASGGYALVSTTFFVNEPA